MRSAAARPQGAAAALVAAGIAALVWIWPGAASAVASGTLDDRVYDVARQLMCPVCAGQTVAESDSAIARQMRDVIRAKLQAGESPAAILRFFVGQFGESVLAEPPRRGLSLLLYAGPLVGVAAGLAIALVCIRRWAARPAGPAAPAGATSAVASEAAAPVPGDAARNAGNGPDEGTVPAGTAGELARLAEELEARDR